MKRVLQPVPALADAPPPEVPATLEGGGRTVTIRCPFCRKQHVHGVPDGQYGPRLSHCHDREHQTYALVPES